MIVLCWTRKTSRQTPVAQDSFHIHLVDDIQKQKGNMKMDAAIIPSGLMSILQSFEVNKLFECSTQNGWL
jgi:hypothetical protein